MASRDVTGDIDFDIIDEALINVRTGEKGAAIKNEFYAYYPSLNKYACSICVSFNEGDEDAAKEHVARCRNLPESTMKNGRIFCATCWRSFTKDNASAHFFSVGHDQILQRMKANGDVDSSVWLMKNGPSFVKPKDSTVDSLKFGVMTAAERLDHALKEAQNVSGEDKLREQLTNAIRAATGNFATANAKLSKNSPLVVGLNNLKSFVTVGYLPCLACTTKDQYGPLETMRALSSVLPKELAKMFDLDQNNERCKVCMAKIAKFKDPKNLSKAITRVASTIIGEYKPQNKSQDDKKRSAEDMEDD